MNLEYDKEMSDKIRREREAKMLKCEECNNTFMEVVEILRVDGSQIVALGQKAAEITSPLFLYRCIKCGVLIEPRLDMTANDPMTHIYTELMKVFNENK